MHDAVTAGKQSLLILYATETGNSLDAAERITREARRRHFATTVASVDEYDPPKLIDEELVVFVLATTGSGEEPRPMKTLWQQLLRTDLPEDLFDEMAFTVFGLGDSAYERFCWASKKLVRRLLGLGAKEFHPSTHSDEQDRFGYETALIPWMDEMFDALLARYPLPDSLEILPASQLPSPRAKISMVEDTPVVKLLPQEPATDHHDMVLEENRRITSESWQQDVRHLTFAFEGELNWDPGDIAILHPHTSPGDVKALLERFNWVDTADSPLRIEAQSSDQPIAEYLLQGSTTLRELFTSVLDISCVPRKSFFETLLHFTDDPIETEKLQEFTSLTAEGQDDLYDYTHRVKRTILEVLQDFRYVSVPLDHLFDLFPPIRPRQFSIANSSRYTRTTTSATSATISSSRGKTNLNVCVAIVSYKTKLKMPRRGLCTTWLANLPTGTPVRVGIRKGALVLPKISGEEKTTAPVICIGPGTGVAPMRAIIQERISQQCSDNTLYFGCRSASQDYYYSDEWESTSQAGKLVFSVAFSRDQDKKVYVQNLIEQDSSRIWDLVDKQKAWIYISGSSNKMPAAVKGAIKKAATTEGGLTDEEATKYISRLEWQGRLYEECWS